MGVHSNLTSPTKKSVTLGCTKSLYQPRYLDKGASLLKNLCNSETLTASPQQGPQPNLSVVFQSI